MFLLSISRDAAAASSTMMVTPSQGMDAKKFEDSKYSTVVALWKKRGKGNNLSVIRTYVR